MKAFSLCLFLLLVSLSASAQVLDQESTPKSTRQIGFTASWLGGQAAPFDIKNIYHPGKAISLNAGLNSFTGKRRKGQIGINLQLDYATANADFERLEGGLILSRFDTLHDVRGGRLDYNSLSLLIPLYYRYYFSKRLFTSINLGIRLALYDDIAFAYSEFDYVFATDEIINLTEERTEKVDQTLTNFSPGIGIGLSFEKAEIELKLGSRSMNYNHFYLFSDNRTELSLTGMYKL